MIYIRKRIGIICLTLIILLGGFLRFYKLDWGEGYYFHPDEYHIVYSVQQLSFPNQMHPHLFSYGSFIVYLIYFTKLITNYHNLFLIGRFYSALFSTLSIVVVFHIGKSIFSKLRFSLIAALLFAITPGIIQQAHFLTPESTQTFWILLSTLLSLKYLKTYSRTSYLLSSCSLGLAIGSKVTSIILIPIIVLLPFVIWISKQNAGLLKTIFLTISGVFLVAGTFFVVFPYSIIDFNNFKNSIIYEVGVGKGKTPVFYTRQFSNTIPIFFHFQKILPYTLGLPSLLTGSAGFLLILYKTLNRIVKKKWKQILPLFLPMLTFMLIFIPNGFFYAKWTRFIAPSFPFMILFSVYLYDVSYSQKASVKILFTTIFSVHLLLTVIWSFMFFSIYLNEDSRIRATNWINNHIPEHSSVLTETGNTLEVPLSGNYEKVAFDFYNIDSEEISYRQLLNRLELSDYFIIQSRRIFVNHIREPYIYPLVAKFYYQLFNGNLGFTEIATFNSFPSFSYANKLIFVDDEMAEETWSVFDHPVIRVYKKTVDYSKTDYEKILNI